MSDCGDHRHRAHEANTAASVAVVGWGSGCGTLGGCPFILRQRSVRLPRWIAFHLRDGSLRGCTFGFDPGVGVDRRVGGWVILVGDGLTS